MPETETVEPLAPVASRPGICPVHNRAMHPIGGATQRPQCEECLVAEQRTRQRLNHPLHPGKIAPPKGISCIFCCQDQVEENRRKRVEQGLPADVQTTWARAPYFAQLGPGEQGDFKPLPIPRVPAQPAPPTPADQATAVAPPAPAREVIIQSPADLQHLPAPPTPQIKETRVVGAGSLSKSGGKGK
jgi:hypothetical protein